MKKKSYLTSVLEKLSEKDIYSLMLFVTYKLKDDQRYSTLSELVYTLDKKSLLNFLSVFGGLTITVPKVDDLKLVANGLLIYQLVNFENIDLDVAIKEINRGDFLDEDLKKTYLTICEVLSDYDFNRP